ncbi:ubiquinol-cytochrome C chaperone [Rhizobium sp. KVB221]|uniref:Ubiquinol-cytochrome C chaperone n=1 Tax=Rhizobium setariae TaxID=2801340 RepID=A0A936YJC5_9HYPH|nr:ubiquinol-cytochrome C chaperone family protein [Rhizobium setariae]MBL0371335.1 ubiquinol-cytochrome C chaperone [Rhizobium setariae]
MIFRFFRKNKVSTETIERQYAVLTAAARQKGFYSVADVPDTVIGRFEMLSIMLILYFRRTAGAGALAKEIAQEVVDAFFEDLDHSFRELGIGDQGVPKRMKKFASMFYGRVDSYGKCLDSGDVDALVIALKRNIHPENNDPALSMNVLAHYMMDAERQLKLLSDDILDRGEATLMTMNEGDGR